jgi:hypothetical protein
MPYPAVYAGCMYTDQDLVVGDLGLVDVPELENVRRAVVS